MNETVSYLTPGGVRVHCRTETFDPAELAAITRQVQDRRGGVLSSGMEYPGRYSRWHLAYLDPPVQIVARGRWISATALNERGAVLLPVIAAALRRATAGGSASTGSASTGSASTGTASADAGVGSGADTAYVEVLIPASDEIFTEEQRSRRPTVFSALREVIAAFAGPNPHLGLYGAFGYDLAFQFEPVRQRIERDQTARDLVLHLPDLVFAVDRKRETASRFSFEFETGTAATMGLPRRDRSAADSTASSRSPVAHPRHGHRAAGRSGAR